MSDQDTVLITCLLLFLKRNSIFKCNYAFNISRSMVSNITSLILRDCDMDSENISLIRGAVADGHKACGSKGISLIGI